MPNSQETKYLYRYFEFPSEYSDVTIECAEFKIIKETPKGYWIDTSLFFGRQVKRFVLKESRKRFAHSTKFLAHEAFIRRKRAHSRYLESRLKTVKAALKKAEWDKEKRKLQIIDEIRAVYHTLPYSDRRSICIALGPEFESQVKKDAERRALHRKD